MKKQRVQRPWGECVLGGREAGWFVRDRVVGKEASGQSKAGRDCYSALSRQRRVGVKDFWSIGLLALKSLIGAKALELRGERVSPPVDSGGGGKNQCFLNASYRADHVLKTVLNAFLVLCFVILASKRHNDKRAINIPILPMRKQGSKRWSDLPVLRVQRWLAMVIAGGRPSLIPKCASSSQPQDQKEQVGCLGEAGEGLKRPTAFSRRPMRAGSPGQLRTQIPTLSSLPARTRDCLFFSEGQRISCFQYSWAWDPPEVNVVWPLPRGNLSWGSHCPWDES